MATDEPTAVDRELERRAEEYAQAASALSSHPVLREGLAKAALNEVIWTLYRAFPENSGEIAEHLDLMGDIVRQQAREDAEKAETPESQ